MEYGSCEGLDRHYSCCIVVCLIGRAAILVIMYVEISKTDVIVLISIRHGISRNHGQFAHLHIQDGGFFKPEIFTKIS